MNIFRKSMLSGLVNFIPVFFMLLLTTTDQLPLFSFGGLFMIAYLFLPGLVYALVIIEHVKSPNRLKSFFFVVLATTTYSVAFTTGASFLIMVKDMAWVIFPISITSFLILLILYYLFLDRKMNLRIALFLGVLLAAACVLAPYVGIVYIKNEDTPGIILSFSVFFTWQTSFGWVLHFSKKLNVNGE